MRVLLTVVLLIFGLVPGKLMFQTDRAAFLVENNPARMALQGTAPVYGNLQTEIFCSYQLSYGEDPALAPTAQAARSAGFAPNPGSISAADFCRMLAAGASASALIFLLFGLYLTISRRSRRR